MTPTALSSRGRAHLIEFEGLRLLVYRDVAGLWTIGVGHLLTAEELRTGTLRIGDEVVPWRQRGLTEDQAYRLLDQDLAWAVRAVRELVRVPLTPGQFDALVSFTFNVGPDALRTSTLLRRLNAGDYAAVPAQLRRWRFAKGREIDGLKNRREGEIALWRDAA
jgi:lysozyme